ncbi:MAG: response regulator transcription factor [Gallionella sp.]|nr:response regulator transcription factor [Gallionella sp.]
MKIRLLIADDHSIVREGLKQILNLQPGIDCAGEAGDGEQVLRLVREGEYDLLLLDMTMDGLSGVDLIRRVRNFKPALPILVLSMHNVSQLALHAIRAGANGYITKGSEPELLLAAIQKVAGGGRYIDPAMTEGLAYQSIFSEEDLPHNSLSSREFEVFRFLASGMNNVGISKQLFISEKTVSTYKSRIMEKLKLSSAAELVRYAVKYKIID